MATGVTRVREWRSGVPCGLTWQSTEQYATPFLHGQCLNGWFSGDGMPHLAQQAYGAGALILGQLAQARAG